MDLHRESPCDGAVVLLAEDEAMVRNVIGLVLRGMGLAVLEAADGPAALRLAGRHAGAIDLLVADVRLPGCTGPAVAARLDVPVLFLSGHPEEIACSADVPAGAPFLAKPFR